MSETGEGGSVEGRVSAPLPPTEERVSAFWAFTRDHVGWATLEGIFGQQQASSVEPPWMHLGDTRGEADGLLAALVREGTLKLATEVPVDAFAEGDLPKRGDLAVVCDGRGRHTSLVATLNVRESEPQKSSDGTPVRIVTETLRCLYPKQDTSKQ